MSEVAEEPRHKQRRVARIMGTLRRSLSTRQLPTAREVLGYDPAPPAGPHDQPGFPPATAPAPPETLPSAPIEKYALSYAVMSATCALVDQMRDMQGLFRVSGAHKLSCYITKTMAVGG
eukprot:m51a1_g11245 hypothetical protein (119) ;mRNA; r:26053-27829